MPINFSDRPKANCSSDRAHSLLLERMFIFISVEFRSQECRYNMLLISVVYRRSQVRVLIFISFCLIPIIVVSFIQQPCKFILNTPISTIISAHSRLEPLLVISGILVPNGQNIQHPTPMLVYFSTHISTHVSTQQRDNNVNKYPP